MRQARTGRTAKRAKVKTRKHKKGGKAGDGAQDSTLTKAQRALKLQKEQEQKEKKQQQMSEPIERAKTYVRNVQKSIRELQLALNESKTAVVRRSVPQRFLDEYEAVFENHATSRPTFREQFEGCMCNDKNS